jgi:Trk K+ transport system NAD-binding subunit
MINHLSDHYVVRGYGRIGSIVASEFKRQKTPFVIVARDPGKVISPYRIGAVQIARTALRPAVVDFVDIATSSANLELSIEKIHIESNSVVVGIQHAQGRMEFNALASTVLRGGDHLIALGSPQTLKELERAAK